jgi:VWFA-related protein
MTGIRCAFFGFAFALIVALSPAALPLDAFSDEARVQESEPASSAVAQTQSKPAADDSKGPALVHRPPPKARSKVTPEGRIHLDVVVSDANGSPIMGLQPWDFKLLDDDASRRILSFHSYGGVAVKPDPPTEVILLIDEVNLPFQQVAIVRSELAEFLQQNGGRLAQPITIMLLTSTGLRVQPRPTTNGNALLSLVKGIKGNISSINPAMGANGALERLQVSVHQLAVIAENEAAMPGRKLLIWLGPGWPLLQRANISFSEKERRRNFNGIVELTNKLREARIVVNSVSLIDPAAGGTYTMPVLRYQDFLKGVQNAKQADTGDLALKVLATHTGGRIMGPDNDLAGQINRCIADANAFYRISFDPPTTAERDEYHELKVQVNQPGLTVRTNTGYYNEPPSY